ncbi:MAG: RNA polymerase sigma factor region1.1 domain-containing protein, partial [Pseudomonadota bacterium]
MATAKTKTKPKNTTKDPQDKPLLDLSSAGMKKFIKQAKAKGYVTHDELNAILPSDEMTSDQIEDTMSALSEMGINVVESEDEVESDNDNESEGAVAKTGDKKVVAKKGNTRGSDRTDDPVRMYLREMGTVELLSREGEIAIAKRIEAGRDAMIRGLCESPLSFEAMMVWRDELMNERILLRDVIDLEATYGAENPPPEPKEEEEDEDEAEAKADGEDGASDEDDDED